MEREGGEVSREVGEDQQEWEEERIRGMEDKRAVSVSGHCGERRQAGVERGRGEEVRKTIQMVME